MTKDLLWARICIRVGTNSEHKGCFKFGGKILSFAVLDWSDSGPTARPLDSSMWQGMGTMKKLHAEWGTPKRQPAGSLETQEVVAISPLWNAGDGLRALDRHVQNPLPRRNACGYFEVSKQKAPFWSQHSSRRGKLLCSSELFIQQSNGQRTHLGDLCRECKRPFGHENWDTYRPCTWIDVLMQVTSRVTNILIEQ